MSKNKPVFHELKIQLYHSYIYVFFEKNGWNYENFNNWYSKTFRQNITPEDLTNCEGVTFEARHNETVIFMAKTAKKSHFLHELLHVTLIILTSIGLKGLTEQEPICYLFDEIVEKLLPVFEKEHPTS